MFLQLTRLNEQKARISVSQIVSYHETENNDKPCTELWTAGNGVFLLKETPEQIDKVLSECYVIVKKAIDFSSSQVTLDNKQDALPAQEAPNTEQEVQV